MLWKNPYLSTTAWIDTFDDQDLAEYTFRNGTGTAWSFSTTTVRSGASVYLDGSGDATYSAITTTSPPGGNLPAQGNAIDIWFNTNSVANADQSGMYYDYGADYWARIDWNPGGTEHIELNAGASGTTSAATFSGVDNTWYRLRVEWDDGATFGGVAGDQTAYLYDASGTLLTNTGTLNDTASAGATEVGLFGDPGTSTEVIYFDSWHQE